MTPKRPPVKLIVIKSVDDHMEIQRFKGYTLDSEAFMLMEDVVDDAHLASRIEELRLNGIPEPEADWYVERFSYINREFEIIANSCKTYEEEVITCNILNKSCNIYHSIYFVKRHIV